MPLMKTAAAAVLMGALLLGACSATKTPDPPPVGNGGGTQTKEQNLAMVEPIESALIALKAMNETGRAENFAESERHFRTFREHWAKVKVELDKHDPKLAQHLEDGATELDLEFKKPKEEIRVWELDEETVKLGRLLSEGAVLMNAPIKEELVQKDPTTDIPFNEEKRIKITLSDHKIEPALIEVDQHTKVTFEVTNTGKEVHEFELAHFAVEIEDLQPGQTQELTLVMLDAGDWEMSCHVPGHYEVGMMGTIKVKPAELKAKN